MTQNSDRAPQARGTPGGPVFAGTSNREPAPQNLADVLERVLDKGIVVVGDIQVRLLDIELLTIKIRLMVASVDRAREMGINWWESDASLQSLDSGEKGNGDGGQVQQLERENQELRDRLDKLEQRLEEHTSG